MSQQGKAPRGIGDMRRRPMSFAEVEHAGDARGALRRLTGLIVGEKGMLAALLAATVFGTGCTIAAPAVQSRAVDLIASGGTDRLGRTLLPSARLNFMPRTRPVMPATRTTTPDAGLPAMVGSTISLLVHVMRVLSPL